MAVEGATVLGKSIQVNGEITGSEDLVIAGRVNGTILLKESRLTVGEEAQIEATLEVHDAVLLGSCKGNIQSTGRVELRKGSSLIGDIFAERLSIEEGAAMQGKVSLTEAK